jgi:two-component sensor histidine kinase
VLTVTWKETDGPTVTAPTRNSFGTQVIKGSVPDADVTLDYKPQGLVCQMRIPMASLT